MKQRVSRLLTYSVLVVAWSTGVAQLAAQPAPQIVPLPAGLVHSIAVEHEVRRGDSLTLLSARYGVLPALIALENELPSDAKLILGQRLRITSRHLLAQELAQALSDGIVINPPQRMLYLLRAGAIAAAYPVGVGRRDWPTPTGEFSVAVRQIDKTWIVPPSIQQEMRAEGKPVLSTVPPGPDNPLGRHWIGLSLPGLGVHSTNAPASIYRYATHGCIRLHPDDAAALFDAVSVGERGRIVYAPVQLLRTDDGRIWFEANADVYRRQPVILAALQREAAAAGVAERIDWDVVARMLRERDGQARSVDDGAQ